MGISSPFTGWGWNRHVAFRKGLWEMFKLDHVSLKFCFKKTSAWWVKIIQFHLHLFFSNLQAWNRTSSYELKIFLYIHKYKLLANPRVSGRFGAWDVRYAWIYCLLGVISLLSAMEWTLHHHQVGIIFWKQKRSPVTCHLCLVFGSRKSPGDSPNFMST